MKHDLIVVGSGFFGLTIAQRAASELNLKVLVLEKRDHLGGNAHSFRDADTGIEVHAYGSHLFHTSNDRVWSYVNRFASFNRYVHTVFSHHRGQLYSMPVNLLTISQLFGEHLAPAEARKRIAEDIGKLGNTFRVSDTFEARALESVGPTIYNALFRNYTLKQWQTDPSELPGQVFSRLPVRFNMSNRYFNDKYEGLPENGYGAMFLRMIDHPNIEIRLGVDFFETEFFNNPNGLTVYTGPIDRYFDYKHGVLGWRTLDFEFTTLDVDDFQGTSVINYPDLQHPFTRIHEFKHFHPERIQAKNRTIIAKEFSRLAGMGDEPYYPINSAEDRQRLEQYRSLAAQEKDVFFGGRLGSYLYLDMHMAIASAFSMFENVIVPRVTA